MSQAKGVLPTKGDDREVLYKNPRACGYFIGISLVEATTPDQLQTWLGSVDAAIATLVAREAPTVGQAKGEKVASVAVGLGSRIFTLVSGQDGSPDLPVGMRPELQAPGGLLPGVPDLGADVIFYVMSVYETRVNEFLARAADSSIVGSMSLERGYQRSDGTEPFGYKDGLRNVALTDRSRVVYIHTDGGQPDEPAWADGGTYMVLIKIAQKPSAFQQLTDDSARDAVIGRTKDGQRLDLAGQHVDPHDEPTDFGPAEPLNAHVRKAGPRGTHDDTHIFRRGLPFMDVRDGQLETGLQFCSFQANPAQFDAVFNDWLMNPLFPKTTDGTAPGADALLDTARGITELQHAGLFFVPPHNDDGILASLTPPASRGKPTKGRLAISKIVLDPNGNPARVERGGFAFQLKRADGTPVEGADFTTASSGRGICPVDLDIGQTYTLIEVASPPGVSVAPPAETQVPIDKPNIHIKIENHLQQPPNSYGG